MDGIFNIDKPEGMTSHDVVARVRRISGRRRAGHAGTLDPFATGVLPVVVGRATRLVEYLSDADKEYRAVVALGAVSDTYDREGTITPDTDAVMPALEEVEAALSRFRGEIEQVPPMHSAIKVGGKKLYELARQGVEVERQPRRVTISRVEVEWYRPPMLGIYVRVSKGTYIRSLAHDLGQALGVGAYLESLVRTRHGPFTIEQATTLEGLEEAFKQGTWRESLFPPEFILEGWPMHTATPEEEADLRQGRPLRAPDPVSRADRRMMAIKTGAGDILAIAEWDGDRRLWQPKKVFPAAEQENQG
jgi:tRNA pseudouridine55 synthase